MMSGHGTNPVFFNEKEIGRLDVQNTHYSHPTPPPTSDNISFLPDPPLPPPPPQSGRHKCITTTLQTFLPTILLKVALLYGCFSHGAKRHKVDIPQNKGKSRPSLEYYDIKKRQNTAKNYWFF